MPYIFLSNLLKDFRNPGKLFLLFYFLLIAVISVLSVYFHEMWCDESQAFLLARDSHSLAELFRNLKYEGHPALWHIVLFFGYKIFPSIYCIQIIHTIIGLLIIALILRFAPFSIPEKVLICSSYLISYEYMAISRDYSIGILFLLGGLAVYLNSKSKYNIIFAALLLGISANCNIYAFILSILLFAYFAFDQWKASGKMLPGKFVWTAAIVLLIFYGLSCLQLMAPADRVAPYARVPAVWPLPFDRLVYCFRRIGDVLFFLPKIGPSNGLPYWGTVFHPAAFTKYSIFDFPHDLYYLYNVFMLHLYAILPALFLYFCYKQLNGYLLIKLFFFLSFLSIFLFDCFVYTGWLRHLGFYFIVLLITIWLFRRSSGSTTDNVTRNGLIAIIGSPLFFQALLWLQANYTGQVKHLSLYFIAAFIVISYVLFISSGFFQSKSFYSKCFSFFFYTILLFQLSSSVIFHVVDFKYSFSDGKNVASYLVQEKLTDKKILIYPYMDAPPVVHYASIPQIYYPELNCYSSYIIWRKGINNNLSSDDILKIATEQKTDVIILGSKQSDPLLLSNGYRLAYKTSIRTIADTYYVYVKT